MIEFLVSIHLLQAIIVITDLKLFFVLVPVPRSKILFFLFLSVVKGAIPYENFDDRSEISIPRSRRAGASGT